MLIFMSKVVDVSGKLEHIARIEYKLSLLARRFLCIPATSDSSERMFFFYRRSYSNQAASVA